MEICGHEIFPELRPVRPRVGESYRDFQRWKSRLERQHEHVTAVEEAARRAKQQAKEEEGEFYLSDPDEYFADANLHAKVRGSQTTGLLDLPPEVLTLIVEHAAGHPGNLSPQTMKSLRLVHPQLGHLRYLKQKLFETLVLTPDPDSLWKIQRSADSIAPFVSTLVFRPVMINKMKIPRGNRKDTDAQIKKKMKPRIDGVIQNGKAQDAWANFLRKLKPSAAIKVWNNMSLLGQRQRHIYACPGPPPQPFLRLVLASLASSGFQATKLEISFCAQSSMVWSDIDEWEDLSLHALKSLHFSCTITDLVHRRVQSDKQLQVFADESASVLQCLLKKSSSTLQDLTIRTQSTLPSSGGLPPLPALQSLQLAHPTTVRAAQLAAWLADLPKLQHFLLGYIRLDGDGDLQGWRPIFDAIRSRSGDLSIDFRGRFTASVVPHFTLLHRKSDPVGEEKGNLKEVIKMLKNYISGLGPWEEY